MSLKFILAAVSKSAPLAVKGDIYASGANYSGYFGDGTSGTGSSSPVQVSTWPQYAKIDSYPIASLYNPGFMSYESWAAVDDSNSIGIWGGVTMFVEGNGSYNPGAWQVTPGAVGTYSPTTITYDGGAVFKSSSPGDGYILAIDTLDRLWGWGRNESKQLGTTVTRSRSWRLIRSSPDGRSMAGIDSANNLFTWGLNTNYQLGLGDTTHRSLPTQVTTTYNGSRIDWSDVVLGESWAAGYDNSGNIYGWGYNSNGQLSGLSYNSNYSVPTFLTSGGTTTYAPGRIAARAGTLYYISGTNYLYGSGSNAGGKLAVDSATSPYLTTFNQITGAEYSTWNMIAAGNTYAVGVTANGTLWGWGNNAAGQQGITAGTPSSGGGGGGSATNITLASASMQYAPWYSSYNMMMYFNNYTDFNTVWGWFQSFTTPIKIVFFENNYFYNWYQITLSNAGSLAGSPGQGIDPGTGQYYINLVISSTAWSSASSSPTPTASASLVSGGGSGGGMQLVAVMNNWPSFFDIWFNSDADRMTAYSTPSYTVYDMNGMGYAIVAMGAPQLIGPFGGSYNYGLRYDTTNSGVNGTGSSGTPLTASIGGGGGAATPVTNGNAYTDGGTINQLVLWFDNPSNRDAAYATIQAATSLTWNGNYYYGPSGMSGSTTISMQITSPSNVSQLNGGPPPFPYGVLIQSVIFGGPFGPMTGTNNTFSVGGSSGGGGGGGGTSGGVTANTTASYTPRQVTQGYTGTAWLTFSNTFTYVSCSDETTAAVYRDAAALKYNVYTFGNNYSSNVLARSTTTAGAGIPGAMYNSDGTKFDMPDAWAVSALAVNVYDTSVDGGIFLYNSGDGVRYSGNNSWGQNGDYYNASSYMNGLQFIQYNFDSSIGYNFSVSDLPAAGGKTSTYLASYYDNIGAYKTAQAVSKGINDYGQFGNGSTSSTSSTSWQTQASYSSNNAGVAVQANTSNNSWTQVYSSAEYALGIHANGALMGWGYLTDNRTGNTSVGYFNSDPTQRVYTQVPTQIASGTWTYVTSNRVVDMYSDVRIRSWGIKSDGTLWSWGGNTLITTGAGYIDPNETYYGGQTNLFISPRQVATRDNISWKSVVADTTGNTVYGIAANNTLWAWGDVRYINTTAKETMKSWTVLDSYDGGAAGISTDGKLWLWGRLTDGADGRGYNGSFNSTIDMAPRELPGGFTWTKCAVGSGTFYNGAVGVGVVGAIRSDGTLWAWGYNTYGTLGQSTIINKSSPVQIGGSWSSIAIGGPTMWGIKTDGTLWAWGSNDYGVLGDGTVIHRSSPVQIGAANNYVSVTALGASTVHALQANGALWGWGYNGNSVVGDGTTAHRSSPVQIPGTWGAVYPSSGFVRMAKKSSDNNLYAWGLTTNSTFMSAVNASLPATPLYSWLSVTSSGNGSILAVKSDGTLWGVGNNLYGNLGTGTANNTVTAITQIGALTNWSKVSMSTYHTLAIKTDGTLWAWGYNGYGGLGDNTIISKSSPVQIGAATTWASISAGDYFGLSAAITSTGALYTWGMNSDGQLGQGLGSTANRSSPVQVTGTWSKVSCGLRHMLAIQTNGTLWSWGYNAGGQLGSSTIVARSSPVQIGAATDWTMCSAHGGNSYGLRGNNLWAWGDNYYGQVGNGGTTGQYGASKSSPVQIGTAEWVFVGGGPFGSPHAIKTDGTLWAWGYNTAAFPIGDGTSATRNVPVQITTANTWSSAGASHALSTSNTLFGWGISSYPRFNTNVPQREGGIIFTTMSSPVQISATSWSSLYVNASSVRAIRAIDGTLWAWGYNGDGQLGDGTIIDRASPVQIGAGTTWSKVFYGGMYKSDGTTWVSGRCDGFALNPISTYYDLNPGIPSLYGRVSSPTQVGATPFTFVVHPIQVGGAVANGMWKKVAAASGSAAGIASDGSLYVWGNNGYGQLGVGTVSTVSSPTQVGTSKRYVDITMTDVTLHAIKG